jgi:hypothetical protein
VAADLSGGSGFHRARRVNEGRGSARSFVVSRDRSLPANASSRGGVAGQRHVMTNGGTDACRIGRDISLVSNSKMGN